MNYEIARELKNAGFPQRFKDGRYYPEKDLTFEEAQTAHLFLDERRRGTPESELEVSKLVSIPNLSELIEACGDDFGYLKRYTADGVWEAGAFEGEGDGQTPEEALARLWLDLNKK